MDILLVLAVGAMCIGCFIVGARVGQQAVRGEEIQMPAVSPMEAVREHKAKKEAQYEQSRLDTILRNIEGYDGTAYGQEDVPGR